MASEKITNILDLIDSLTILELNELVEGVQEKYGVSAVVAAAPAAGGAAAAERAVRRGQGCRRCIGRAFHPDPGSAAAENRPGGRCSAAVRRI